MATLLTIREEIKNFCSKYDRFITPLVKFILALAMFWSIVHLTGYNDTFGSGMVIFLLSLVCAFMTEGITLALGGFVGFMHFFSASKEIAVVYLILFVLMYCIYIRFFPKTAWLIMFTPLFFILKLQYFVPVLAGMLVGPAGMISAAFGCIFYYFANYAAQYVEMMGTYAEEDLIEGYRYMFQHLVEDKNLMLTMVVFAVIIVATNIVYKLSFEFSWYAAIIVGGLFESILFLIGNFVLEASVSVGGVLLGSIVAILLGVVVQFFKTVVDYSRVENTQFEDDEYYYYVKAVPKVVMGKQQKNIRKISEVTPAVTEEEDVDGATR